MGLILDTSLLIAIERGDLNIDAIDRADDEPVGISVVTAAELLHGVHRADSEARRVKREAYVERLLAALTVHPFDLTAARTYARLWADLSRKGVRIGAHDLMIASTAIASGYAVATLNIRDYGRIEGLKLVRI